LLFAGDEPDVRTITPAHARALAAAALPDSRDVRFGDAFTLIGVATERTPDGLVVRLAWRSERRQRLDRTVALHLIDDAGGVVAVADYPQDWLVGQVEPGNLWLDQTSIPSHKPNGVTRLALALYGADGRPDQSLPLDPRPRDSNGSQLLLPLPPTGHIAQ
jgi:hypothetical protein